MDEELDEVLELTRDDLVAKLKGGQPADLVRVPPVRVRVGAVTISAPQREVLQQQNSATRAVRHPMRSVRQAVIIKG